MESHYTESQSPEASRIGFGFLFQWVIANAAGVAIGMAVRQFMFGLGAWATNPLVVGAVVGTAVGGIQIFNLKEHVNRAGVWWILSHTIGWALGWAGGWHLGWSVIGGLGINEVFTLIGALAGTIAGLIQWVILRQQFKWAFGWPVANAVGWAIGMAVGFAVGGAFGWPLIGAIGGVITGLALIWLIQRPIERSL